ncbi:hypothetical protein QN277_004759 [Acacia crassicarpa]|uniref:RNA-dependent RNA polymerase n=1 Tax=Acacia crassicarpa TaxID=499986 RepID=A0AAE1J146_9FABA|nr:hypothetical protein QN277_004759 [Acacia crassicarpa]
MGRIIQLYGFPHDVSVSTVKPFVEQITGEGTVFAIEIKQGKRAFAIIQFKDAKHASYLISLADKSIWYGRSYLKARALEKDTVPKPRTFLHTLADVKLHFGCLMSKERFHVLWKSVTKEVNFGINMRKIQFLLSYRLADYKLELSYENIWQAELHRPRGETAVYLLIQLVGAPRVFEKYARTSRSIFEDPFLNFCEDSSDDQWIRTVDFTPFSCIGQSSHIYLQLPSHGRLSDFRENFAYYKESERKFSLEEGSHFSSSLTLVPIVAPPRGIYMPYDILFKLNSLLQHGCLAGPAIDRRFYHLIDPHEMGRDFVEYALEKMYFSKEFCSDPSNWMIDQSIKYGASQYPPQSPSISLDNGLVYVRRVKITPCKVYFCGPEVNVSNRVLRHFDQFLDNFLRVSFVDEELGKLFSTDLSLRNSSSEQRKTEIYTRILSILRNGIVIGDKKFEFLAFSSSQLRENSLWMFAPAYGLNAAAIRDWMGNFRNIRNVAKYAARLGQSFGSSTEALSVSQDETEMIPDVVVKSGGIDYIFSDGIGKISAEFAKKVSKKCGYKSSTPSAFQIRYGGYKGVVAVDPTSSVKLSLRKSMLKFDSDNTKLDVLGCSKFQPCYLNRQIITLLSTLGVKDHVFEKKQKEAINQLNSLLTDSLKAREALDLMSAGEISNIMKEMLICGYRPDAEPFLSMTLQTFRASKLLGLRRKARIFVPQGRAMMGCLDETRTLEYGQVFVQYSRNGSLPLSNGSAAYGSKRYIVKRKVVVAKNPCLHPGDVRVLKAVDVPALHHMVDCVVFPQKGSRPHPNECSGSDLDGDIYFVCWDPELIPPHQKPPMDYTPAQSIQLDHDVMIEEVEEYFANYIVNDSLGIIANAHTVFADRESNKAMAAPCIELAKLFSTAVDFPKTGVPAVIPRELYVKEYPDFMEKPDKPTYKSMNVIGKLFREVKEIAPEDYSSPAFTREMARRSYDPDMEVDGFMDYVDDAFYHKSNYDFKLGNLMDYYGIKTEAEILSGNIMRMSKSFSRRRDAEAITMAVRSLRKEARNWFNSPGSAEDSWEEDVNAKASAWYYVTYHPSYWGRCNEGLNRAHFLSFAWCVYDKLVTIKKEKASIRRSRQLSSLEHRFRSGLRLS